MPIRTPAIYLDNAATTWPKPRQVAEEMSRFLAEEAGNPGRGGHQLAIAAQRVVHDARVQLAKLFGGTDPNRFIHCSSCTDALNIAIKGVLHPGDHVVTSVLEHNSVARPLRAMADAGLIELSCVNVNADGLIDPRDVQRNMTSNTRLIALSHASNVTGVIQPIADVARIVREQDVLFLVDAAQTAGVLDIDVDSSGIDLLAVPGHKSLFGPPGTGGLYVGGRASVRPWREGGTGGDSTNPVQPDEFPHRLEAGTPNTVGIAGLLAAVRGLNPPAALRHERSLLERLIAGIGDDSRFRILGPLSSESRVGVLSLTVRGVDSAGVAAILDQRFGIAVRAGLHCAPGAHRAHGTFPSGAVRISPSWVNTLEDMDTLVGALQQIAGG